jgi:hypothetical protein
MTPPKKPRARKGHTLVLRCFLDSYGPLRSQNRPNIFGGKQPPRFVYPTKGPVAAPDWNNKPGCGWGLHGWEYGHGDRGFGPTTISFVSCDCRSRPSRWMVLSVPHRYRGKRNLIRMRGKVKFGRGSVVFVGTYEEARAYLEARITPAIRRRLNKKEHSIVAKDSYY